MAVIANAVQINKNVASPIASYDSMKDIWDKNRAVCSGERFVKAFDSVLDINTYKNLLIPFSPTMSVEQYSFYKAEAEFPGITALYAKMLVGGLLRKQPTLKLPDDAPADAYDWIMKSFGQDGAPLVSFLDDVLWEEVQTSRAWIFVEYPKLNIKEAENLTKAELLEYKPYPVLVVAESVINWKMSRDGKGNKILSQLIIRGFEESFEENEFHPNMVSTVWVHEIVDGAYQIRKYRKNSAETAVPVIAGQTQKNYVHGLEAFDLVETNQDILINGERMTIIPAWPVNGSVDITEALLNPIIDREIGLYNKISRRNHLLYGASTYTPYISTEMTDEQFDDIVNAGLGTWIKIGMQDKIGVLDTPTAALKDMEAAIASTITEMAKMGLRMLAPESAESGVALDIRNAAQTAQLGTFNIKVSNQIGDMISFMLNWRYGTEYKASDIHFSLSADFNPTPLGADWLRLATEWYQQGYIPRSVWLEMLKLNDMIPPDYDDKAGIAEINKDELITTAKDKADQFAQQMQQQQGMQQA